MKISRSQIRKIVRSTLINENFLSKLGAKFGFDTKEVNQFIGHLKKSHARGKDLLDQIESGEEKSVEEIREHFESIYELMEKLKKAVEEEGMTSRQKVFVDGILKRASAVHDELEMEYSIALEDRQGR